MKVIESRQIPIVNTRQVVWQPIADNGDLSMRLAPIDWQPSGAHACIQMLADDLRNAEAKLTKVVESIKQSIKLWEKYDDTELKWDRDYKLDNAYDGFELLCKALSELEKL